MRAQQQGFALIAAIILVVLLAALSAFVASMVSGQSANQQLERMSRVADLAARAGLEWGAYQVLRVPPPSAALPCAVPPAVPPTIALNLPGSFSAVTVTVTCSTPTLPPSSPAIYRITATATYGGASTSPDYVERQKTAVFFQ